MGRTHPTYDEDSARWLIAADEIENPNKKDK